MYRTFLLASCLSIVSSAASAQIVSIAPFTGTDSEGFETQAAAGMSGFQPCLIGRAFNNQADVCAPVGGGVHVTGSWSFACVLQEHSGTWLFGSTSGSYVEFSFDVPIRRFGGYMATNTPNQGTTTVRFYDAAHVLIGAANADVFNDCVWRWNGWESLSADVWFIEVENSEYGGGRVLMDDLEIDASGSGVGTNYCVSAPNSTGLAATISASGSNSVGANNCVLRADPVPSATLGVFFYGQDPIQVPFGNGFRCVSPGSTWLARLPIVQADLTGVMQYALDYSSPMHAATQITAGSTWRFQAWFQDPAAGGSGFNLSDGFEVSFVP